MMMGVGGHSSLRRGNLKLGLKVGDLGQDGGREGCDFSMMGSTQGFLAVE